MWTELNVVTEKAPGGWTWLSMLGGQIVEEIELAENRQSNANLGCSR